MILFLKVCQCPESGKPHFYNYATHCQKIMKTGVNALSRANLISTIMKKMKMAVVIIVSMP